MSKLDTELVQGLRQDSVQAFDSLYWKYHQAVYRNILKFTKEAVIAEDILQEVFIKLWEKRKDIDEHQSIAGWLFVISFNLSVNHTRKKLRENNLHKLLRSTDDLQLLAPHTPGSPDLYEEQYRILSKAIEQLSPQKRKIITLCKLEGKTYEEAAGELGITRHTVKEHLSAAMVNLNDYVRKNPEYTYLLALLLSLKS